MKIAFDADVLKQLLVEAGIDSNDAKAIVYDLMLLSQSGNVPRKPTNVGVNPVDPKPQQAQQPVQQQPQQERSRVRTHKRLSFEQFGGAASPLKE